MDVREIVNNWLRDNGFDGLCNENCSDGCGCSIHNLMPCSSDGTCISNESPADCKPGHYGKDISDMINSEMEGGNNHAKPVMRSPS